MTTLAIMTKAEFRALRPRRQPVPRPDCLWHEGADPIAVISAIRDANPYLHCGGIGSMYGWANKLSMFRQERAHMTDEGPVGQFLCAIRFLELAEPFRRRTPNTTRSSYHWKHVAENQQRRYISNGMLICAAHALGYVVKKIPDSPNVWIGLGAAAEAIPAVERSPLIPA